MLFVVASVFLLANNIVASADTVANPSTVATTDLEQGKPADKRSLRVRETEEDDGDTSTDNDDATSSDNDDEEERWSPKNKFTLCWDWMAWAPMPGNTLTIQGTSSSRKNGGRSNKRCCYQVGAIFIGEGLVLAKASYASISRSNNVNIYLIQPQFVLLQKGQYRIPPVIHTVFFTYA
ncbi:hypothetical protein PF003_g36962 [Phytophthora fragariae]|nr:hypothetical protein PF003_g36962 [Phytophthora fragariae]